MIYMILGCLLCLSSVFFMKISQHGIWGGLGIVIGGFLIIKGREKLGLSKDGEKNVFK